MAEQLDKLVIASCPRCRSNVRLERSPALPTPPGGQGPETMWSGFCRCGAGVSLAYSSPETVKRMFGGAPMGESTIEWTHKTFNPWLGCAKVHAGCTNCYAEKNQAVNMRKGGPVPWGEVWQGGGRAVVSENTWAHPFAWARAAAKAGERHRVFCASLPVTAPVPLALTSPKGGDWDEWPDDLRVRQLPGGAP